MDAFYLQSVIFLDHWHKGFLRSYGTFKRKNVWLYFSSIYKTTNGGGESREGYLVTREDGSVFDLADFPPGAFVVGDKVKITSLANPAGLGIVKGRSMLKLCVLSAIYVWSFMLLFDEVKPGSRGSAIRDSFIVHLCWNAPADL